MSLRRWAGAAAAAGILAWLALGKIALGDYDGRMNGTAPIDAWLEAGFLSEHAGLWRFDIRLFPGGTGERRDVIVRLRDAAEPWRDLAAWRLPPGQSGRYVRLEIPPLLDSEGRRYLLLLEPGEGVGLAGNAAVAVHGAPNLTSLADGAARGTLEMRRYHLVPPLVWARAMAQRAAAQPFGWLGLASAAASAAIVGWMIRAQPPGLGWATAAGAAGIAALQAASAISAWQGAPARLPDESERIARDLARPTLARPLFVSSAWGLYPALPALSLPSGSALQTRPCPTGSPPCPVQLADGMALRPAAP